MTHRPIASTSRWIPGRRALLAAAALCGLTQPAFAHHAMGERLPSTPWEGLLSGLAHPVIGLDHLAFILGVGIWSALSGLRWTAPALFVLGTLAGCALHVQSVTLPFGEGLVALSLVVAGAALLVVQRAQTWVLSGLLAVAGVLHGYAYGESIVGAQAEPLGAYLFGFALIQLAIAQLAHQLYQRASAVVPARAERMGRAWATGACALGGLFLVLQIAG
jgi:urease accessory protein